MAHKSKETKEAGIGKNFAEYEELVARFVGLANQMKDEGKADRGRLDQGTDPVERAAPEGAFCGAAADGKVRRSPMALFRMSID